MGGCNVFEDRQSYSVTDTLLEPNTVKITILRERPHSAAARSLASSTELIFDEYRGDVR